jgi:hypothetical protein
MKVVHHHGRMPKRCHQRAGIPTPGVQRDRRHPGQPTSRPGTEPAVHRGPAAVGHHIQQPTTLQAHQPRDPSGGRLAGGLEEAGLVQAEGCHSLQPRSVIHQRAAVLSHGPHHGRPADPQVTSDRSVSTARGRIAAHCSVQVRTPQAGSPQRHTRLRQASTTGRPPNGGRGPGPCAGRGAQLASRSPDSRPSWPWSGPQAATHRLPPAREDLKAVQAQQRRPRRTTVLTHLGPPLAGRKTSASYARPRCRSGTLRRRHWHLTTLHDEEPHLYRIGVATRSGADV